MRTCDIDVAVRDSTVTLSRLVDLASQRDRTERDALAVPGVASVHNRLRVVFPVSADDVAERITDAIGPRRDRLTGATGDLRPGLGDSEMAR